jgi:hypothetical protein
LKNFKFLVLFSLLCFSSLSLAQQGAGYNYLRLTPTSLPSKCIAGDLRISSSYSTLQVCYPSNSWNQVVMTGTSSPATAGGITYGIGTGLSTTSAGTSGYFLQSSGSGAPTFVQNPAVTQQYWTGFQAGSWSGTQCFGFGTNSGGNALASIFSNGLTVTAASSNNSGITFTPASSTAVYHVTFATDLQVAAGGGVTNIQLLDTYQNKNFASQGVQYGGSGTTYVPATVSGIDAPGTTGSVTINAQYCNLAGSSSGFGTFNTGASTQWTVIQIK